jgi:hypothetical protein
MRRLAVGSFAASCIVVFACQNTGGPGAPPAYGQPAPGYGAPPAYGQTPGAPGYGQQPAGYPAPAYGQPPIAAAPGYPAPAGYPQAPPAYAPQPGYPAPAVPVAPGAPAAGGAAMAVPGPAAFPCVNDSACGLAHCNVNAGPDGKPYNKCAFPCADANVDCISGSTCLAGFCVPKPPGS